MEVKAIMCDLDGTLLTSGGTVSPVTREAIRKAREKGILFGLSTGRDVHSVKTLLKEWGIDGLVDAIVGTGGAEICDISMNVEKASFPLDGALILEIMKHFGDMDVNFAVPYEGILSMRLRRTSIFRGFPRRTRCLIRWWIFRSF